MTPRVARVSDPADPRIVDYVGLKDPELRHKYEAHAGVFIVEGILAIRALLASRYRVLSMLMSDALLVRLRSDLDAYERDVDVFVAPKTVLEETTGYAIHRGAVAAAARPAPAEPAPLLSAAAERGVPVAVLERVNDHENLGALFRNAAAFDVGAVLLDPACSDPLYRRAVRVSIGHVLAVPFARLDPWPDGLGDMTAAGYTVVALTPDGDVDVSDVLESDGRPAFVLGSEGQGLSDGALAKADVLARIPMARGVDSLNVATAAAIAFHAAFHRRA